MTRPHQGLGIRVRPPDVVFLATTWQSRALIRAQLVEDGFEVLATNTWAMMRRHLRPGMKPRLALIDLQGLSDAAQVLNDLRVLMRPERVLVLTAIGAMPVGSIERFGFHALQRPIAIKDVVQTAAGLMRTADETGQA